MKCTTLVPRRLYHACTTIRGTNFKGEFQIRTEIGKSVKNATIRGIRVTILSNRVTKRVTNFFYKNLRFLSLFDSCSENELSVYKERFCMTMFCGTRNTKMMVRKSGN